MVLRATVFTFTEKTSEEDKSPLQRRPLAVSEYINATYQNVSLTEEAAVRKILMQRRKGEALINIS